MRKTIPVMLCSVLLLAFMLAGCRDDVDKKKRVTRLKTWPFTVVWDLAQDPLRQRPKVKDLLEKMALVPAGEFIMGRDPMPKERRLRAPEGFDEEFWNTSNNETPAHIVTLKAFYADLYTVTNEDYKHFVESNGYALKQYWDLEGYRAIDKFRSDFDGNFGPRYWRKGTFPPGKGKHPVVGVSYYEAAAYARWARKRLPTESEWEKAARGTNGSLFPWGNRFVPAWCNSRDMKGETIPSDSLIEGRSPYGCVNMAGNVWEWTSAWYLPYPGNIHPDDSYGERYKVVRGGSWKNSKEFARSTYRLFADPYGRYNNVGFRCLRSVDPEEQDVMAARERGRTPEALQESRPGWWKRMRSRRDARGRYRELAKPKPEISEPKEAPEIKKPREKAKGSLWQKIFKKREKRPDPVKPVKPVKPEAKVEKSPKRGGWLKKMFKKSDAEAKKPAVREEKAEEKSWWDRKRDRHAEKKNIRKERRKKEGGWIKRNFGPKEKKPREKESPKANDSSWKERREKRAKERLAERESVERRREAERLAREDAARKRTEADRLAKEAERKRVEAESLAREAELKRREAARIEEEKAEAQRLKQAAARREAERIAKEKEEAARLERERLAKEEFDRKQREAKLAEARRLEEEAARHEAERAAKVEAERKRLEAERLAEEEAKRDLREKELSERDRRKAEKKALKEAERKKRESERLAKIEAKRKAREEERAEEQRQKEEAARLEAERIAKEKAEAARRETERLAKEEFDRKQREEKLAAARRAEEEATRREAERLAKEEAERKRLEAERLAKKEAERNQREKAIADRKRLKAEEQARKEAERLAKRTSREKRESATLAKKAAEPVEPKEAVRSKAVRKDRDIVESYFAGKANLYSGNRVNVKYDFNKDSHVNDFVPNSANWSRKRGYFWTPGQKSELSYFFYRVPIRPKETVEFNVKIPENDGAYKLVLGFFRSTSLVGNNPGLTATLTPSSNGGAYTIRIERGARNMKIFVNNQLVLEPKGDDKEKANDLENLPYFRLGVVGGELHIKKFEVEGKIDISDLMGGTKKEFVR